MAQPKKQLIIGTRESKLAMWQAKYAHRLLTESTDKTEGVTFDIKGMTTKGDKDQNTSLSKFSDKGIFTKELDIALMESNIDYAVHCVKDLPTAFHHKLGIGCYLKRGVKNDMLIIDKIRHPNAKSISDLPNGSIIGTGSLRRQSLLKLSKFNNNISVQGIRGNLNTRLRKLVVDNLYDAIILAQIGVERLGWMMHENQIKNNHDIDQNALKINVFPLSMYSFPYAIGQGALAIMCRQSDIDKETKIYKMILKLNNFHSEMCCEMERNLLRILEGGCKVPIATRSDVLTQCKYCNLWNSIERDQCQACFRSIHKNNQQNKELRFYIYGLVLSQDGNTKIHAMQSKSLIINDFNLNKLNHRDYNQYKEILTLSRNIGENVANKLKEQGAQQIIDHIKQQALLN